MEGLLMPRQLLVDSMFRRAEMYHGRSLLRTYMASGELHTLCYADWTIRVRKLMTALQKLGVKPGDRVGTFAFNHHMHLELYFAVPLLGAVLHTINVRLFEEQVEYIILHAEDKVLFVDHLLAASIAPFLPKLRSCVRHMVLMDPAGPNASPPPSESIPQLLARFSAIIPTHAYEELLLPCQPYCGTSTSGKSTRDFTAAPASSHFSSANFMPPFDEFPVSHMSEQTAAALCYTSGTTGNPKGVLYSHRGVTLAAWGCCLTDFIALRESDRLLLVTPMFHVNAWSLPYAAVITGAEIVFPGRDVTPSVIVRQLLRHSITQVGAVPTVWLGILEELRSVRKAGAFPPPSPPDTAKLPLARLRGIVGGSACPAATYTALREEFGVTLLHCWGMTEMSPHGSGSFLKRRLQEDPKLSDDERLGYQMRQGISLPGVELRIVDEAGRPLPWNGKAVGELQTRGPWVASAYYRNPTSDAFQDGWLRTGDMACIDSEGYVKIADRAKDVIKSGGEWISSLDVEAALARHPMVLEAAVVGIAHPKFMERPLALLVLRPSPSSSPSSAPTACAAARLAPEELLQSLLPFLRTRIARWWVPDSFLVVKAIPKTSVGKIDKKVLREQYADYYQKNAAAAARASL